MDYRYLLFLSPFFLLGILPASSAQALDQDYMMEMTSGGFSPQVLEVPAGEKIHLTVKNSGKSETEFESYPLDQEHEIKSGEAADMYIGPLDPGEYPVFDDNNPNIKGRILAK